MLALLGDDLDPDAVEELQEVIVLRVESQLGAIEQGLQVCPEFSEGE